mgnify:CR=1 FL=1
MLTERGWAFSGIAIALIGRNYNVEIVLDNHDRVSCIYEAMENKTRVAEIEAAFGG